MEDEEVPAGKEPENAVAEEVEFFPDYLSLVEGEGLPEKGLLSADELRKRICYSQVGPAAELSAASHLCW